MQAGRFSVTLLLQLVSTYNAVWAIPTDPLNVRREREAPEVARMLITCSKDVTENLVNSTVEICSQIETVDRYIKSMISRQPVSVNSITNRHGFKNILEEYNVDLKTAQDSCSPWRSGENIVGLLNRMVAAVQGFQSRFQDKYRENQERVKYLLENHEGIKEVETKILNLEADVRDANEAARMATVSAVLDRLERIIKVKVEEINNTLNEHELVKAKLEVTELVKYLDFVKSGVTEVEGKAEIARAKISHFSESIMRDAGAFRKHRSNAYQGIDKLREEKQSINDEIADNRRSIDNLRTMTAEQLTQIESLKRQIEESQRELSRIEGRIDSIQRQNRRKKESPKLHLVTSIVGCFVGNKSYQDDLGKEKELAKQKRSLIAAHSQMAQNLQGNMARRNKDIVQHQRRISNLEVSSCQLHQELQLFRWLNEKLQSLEKKAKAILPPVANTVAGTSKMKDTFSGIKKNLENTILKARETKAEEDLTNLKFLIYNEIEGLKCEWDTGRDRIRVEDLKCEWDGAKSSKGQCS